MSSQSFQSEPGRTFGTLGDPFGQVAAQGIRSDPSFYQQGKAWTGPQIHEFNYLNAVPLLLRSAVRYGCSSCMGEIGRIEGGGGEKLMFNLL